MVGKRRKVNVSLNFEWNCGAAAFTPLPCCFSSDTCEVACVDPCTSAGEWMCASEQGSGMGEVWACTAQHGNTSFWKFCSRSMDTITAER